jgi:hypothetical protein
MIRRWLAGRPQARPGGQLWLEQLRAYSAAQLLVRAYYAGLLYLAFTEMSAWAEMAGFSYAGLLWPVFWVRETGLATGVVIVSALHLGGALMAAVAPDRRFCRALAALGLLEFTALNYSVGKIGHGMHLWVLTSLVLIFLPNLECGLSPRRNRQDFLNVFWTAHALVLLTYTMSGLGKVAGAFYQFSRGEVTAFHPQAMALHIAQRLLETGANSQAGLWLVEHTWVSWPLMLGTIYLQFFAFWSIFRPNLIKIWSVGLIAFHLVTYWVLPIRFAPPVLLLAMWGLGSPFAPEIPNIRDILRELPLVGFVIELRSKKSVENARNLSKSG